MEEKEYWFITVFEKCEKDKELNIPIVGDQRCWGFYTNKQDALNTLHENRTDIWEFCYNYAILEKYYEGISAYAYERQFFKYDPRANGYVEIEEPEILKHVVSFAIG